MIGNSTLDHDKMIFCEMMSHPVLYSHNNPNEVMVIGDENHTILPEILKHNRLHCIHFVTKNKMAAEQTYAKVEHHYTDACDWFKKEIKPVDIIIHLNKAESTDFHHFYKNLKSHGILLQQSDSLFKIEFLKSLAENCKNAGFSDLKILHFPQSYGSKTAIMAVKQGFFKQVREKEVYNKNFETQYYNFDMHKAAFALPEFFRREWVI